MNYVSHIAVAFGGIRRMAREIDKPVSTVQSWKDRGSIPDEHKPTVLNAAQKRELPIDKGDFFPASGVGAGK